MVDLTDRRALEAYRPASPRGDRLGATYPVGASQKQQRLWTEVFTGMRR